MASCDLRGVQASQWQFVESEMHRNLLCRVRLVIYWSAMLLEEASSLASVY